MLKAEVKMKFLIVFCFFSFQLMAQVETTTPLPVPPAPGTGPIESPTTTPTETETDPYATVPDASSTTAPVSDELGPQAKKVEEIQTLPPEMTGSSLHRQNSLGSVMLGYQVLTSWVPFKWTASYTQIFNRSWSAELEYSRGNFGVGLFGFDAARIREHRYSLLGRRYFGNSFNILFGAFKNDFHASLGSGLLNNNEWIDDFRVQGMGLTIGIGNRWQWHNGFTMGVDWFRLNIPLIDKKVENDVLNNIEDNSDLRSVRDNINRVRNLPNFVLLGVNLGYTF
jgi:hypothetical protein